MPALTRVVDPLGLWPRAATLSRRAGRTAAEAALDGFERALASPLAERAVRTALRGPLVEATVRVAVEQHVAERVAGELLDTGALDRVLDNPRLRELAGRTIDGETMERLVDQLLTSHVLDASVARVLASEQLWLVVDEIAQSPAVTDAIAHQGVGFADQVAEEVGERSRRADDRLERLARRLLHRSRPPAGSPPAVAQPGPS